MTSPHVFKLSQVARPLAWLGFGLFALLLVGGIGYHHVKNPANLLWEHGTDRETFQLIDRFSISSGEAYHKELRSLWSATKRRNNYNYLSLRLQSIFVQQRLDFVTLESIKYTTTDEAREKTVQLYISGSNHVNLEYLTSPMLLNRHKNTASGNAVYIPNITLLRTLLEVEKKAFLDGKVVFLELQQVLTGADVDLLRTAQNAGATGVVVFDSAKRYLQVLKDGEQKHLHQVAKNFYRSDQDSIPVVVLPYNDARVMFENLPQLRNQTLGAETDREYPVGLKVKTEVSEVHQDHLLGYINGHIDPRDYVLVGNSNRTVADVNRWVTEVSYVLELANAFSKMKHERWRPHRTIVFSIFFPLNFTKTQRTLHFEGNHLNYIRLQSVAQFQIASGASKPKSKSIGRNLADKIITSPLFFSLVDSGVKEIVQLVSRMKNAPYIGQALPIVTNKVVNLDCFNSGGLIRFKLSGMHQTAGYHLVYQIHDMATSLIYPANLTYYAKHLQEDFEHKIFAWLQQDPRTSSRVSDMKFLLYKLQEEATLYYLRLKNITPTTDLSYYEMVSIEAANSRLKTVQQILTDASGLRSCTQRGAVVCNTGPSCFPVLHGLLQNWISSLPKLALLNEIDTECLRVSGSIQSAISALNL